MKLVRNTTNDNTCKYAIIRLDKLRLAGKFTSIDFLNRQLGIISDFVEYGIPHSKDEFFVIKLKDINSRAALLAYANAARLNGDNELAGEVLELANRSGVLSHYQKNPD